MAKNEMYEWRKYKQYYTEKNGKVTFRDDTPSYVLESYQLYCDQMESLNTFMDRHVGGGLLSVFDRKPKSKENDADRQLAQDVIKYRCQNRTLPKSWFAFDVKYHDGHGHTYNGYENLPAGEETDYRITGCAQEKNRIYVMWKRSGYTMMTVFLVKNNKIQAFRDFISEI